jgi:hypothetical protein
MTRSRRIEGRCSPHRTSLFTDYAAVNQDLIASADSKSARDSLEPQAKNQHRLQL